MICDASEYRTPCYFRLCPVSITTSSTATAALTASATTSKATTTTTTTATTTSASTSATIKSKCNKINTCNVNCYCIGSNVNDDANVNSSPSTNEFVTTNSSSSSSNNNNNSNLINSNSCLGKSYYFNSSQFVKSNEIEDANLPVNYVNLNNGNMKNEDEDDLNQLCHQLQQVQHQSRHSSTIKLNNINCLSNSFGLINNFFTFDFGQHENTRTRSSNKKFSGKELIFAEKCSLNVSSSSTSPMVTTTATRQPSSVASVGVLFSSEKKYEEESKRTTNNQLNSQNDIISIDLFARENAKAHRTSAYEIVHNPANPSLVIRRGDPFYLALRMRGGYDQSRDKIRLEFMYGPRPLLGKKTLIYLPVTTNREFTKDSSRWDARTHRVDGNIVTVQVHIPANVAVGVWRLRVSTKQQGSRLIKSFDARERIYVLFNAWCKEDPVYMENEDRRREYVLNDVGKIYIGSHSKPKGRKWIYGQFTDTVLPAVMFMLDKTRLDYTARANPVKVSRAVAAMVNSHDDNGVLVGNWSGSYESGTPPWQWTGSAPIMDQYLRTNGEPVKFGQCWVFAGVTTTVSKALGIPSRTVTNFVSAHDTDDSLTVDKFFDKSGETISDVNSDSIWNFHVWTDVWMTRFDLPPGYSGWQVIDSTPQETSDGLYRTGPASVESIRRGEIGLTYDSPFVFSEVNADVVHWELDERSEFGWKKIKTNKYHVGRKLFTKRIGYLDESPGGLNDAEDITHQYKNREGTEEERAAVLNAARKSGLSFLFELPFSSRN